MHKTVLVTSLLLAATAAHAGEVSRSSFTTMIDQREPVDSLDQVTMDQNRIVFFSELVNMNGERAIHRWMFGDEIMAEVAFDIGSDRWRVWSSKNLVPSWQGQWTVEVVDGTGNVIGSDSFTYGE